MINTNELMLGNLVEYRGEYVTVIEIDQAGVKVRNGNKTSGDWRYCTSDEINPIELTTEIIERLELVGSFKKTLHEWQNARTIHGRPIDITPLLKPKPILTTHDGVEVFDKSTVIHVAYQSGCNGYDPKIKDVVLSIPLSIYLESEYPALTVIFSTLEKCQSYIDQKWAELHPEPIFVTEDGVGIYKGMKYCYCFKNGYRRDGNKCTVINCAPATVDSGSREDVKYFSTEAIAQAYINKVWAENEYQSLLKSK